MVRFRNVCDLVTGGEVPDIAMPGRVYFGLPWLSLAYPGLAIWEVGRWVMGD